MRIAGHFEDGLSSRRHAAELLVEGHSARVVGEDGELGSAARLNDIVVSSRLGNTPRHLHFPEGGSFVTDDNDAIDRAFGSSQPLSSLLFRMESHLRLVLVALVVTVVAVGAGIHWGVPALARHIAFSLPANVGESAEEVTLAALDGRMLKPSRLDDGEQRRLHAAFQPILAMHDSALGLQVMFRDAEHSVGANALALPAGTIIFTDQLVRLARHDDELIAILAHEIGHVAERHALRRAIQASTLSLLTLFLAGDVSSVASGIAALPVMLTELGYSRGFEREADGHAVATLAQLGIPPQRLADILQRLAPDADGHGYLSTHPPTPERVKAIAGPR